MASKALGAVIAVASLAGCAHMEPGRSASSHQAMMTLDTHLDTPIHFGRRGWSFADKHDAESDVAQVDMGRMSAGDLDGGFFAIYTEQGPITPEGYAAALRFARGRSDLIDATLARHSDRIRAVTTSAQARDSVRGGKLFGFKSIENSYPLGEDLDLLAEFQRRGVRLAGPVHSSNNQFADSSTDKPRWNGLSPLGRRWVEEMNRLGIVIDASHASDAAFDQMLSLSRTPLLLSHSSPRAIHDHPRNLDDERIRRLAAAGGAICVSTIYLVPMNMTEERARLFASYERIGQLSPEEQEALAKQWRALDGAGAIWQGANLDLFIKALLHTISVAGVDHVCIGADWDGGGGVAGLDDIADLPEVTARLKAAGLSDGDIEKIWSGNVLRILDAAERAKSGGGLVG